MQTPVLENSRVHTAIEKLLKFSSVVRSWKNHWIFLKFMTFIKIENHGKITECWSSHSWNIELWNRQSTDQNTKYMFYIFTSFIGLFSLLKKTPFSGCKVCQQAVGNLLNCVFRFVTFGVIIEILDFCYDISLKIDIFKTGLWGPRKSFHWDVTKIEDGSFVMLLLDGVYRNGLFRLSVRLFVTVWGFCTSSDTSLIRLTLDLMSQLMTELPTPD